MANWNAIQRNSRTSGHFAGRSVKEQDDYFTFFEGVDTLREVRKLCSNLRRVGPTAMAVVHATLRRRWARLSSQS